MPASSCPVLSRPFLLAVLLAAAGCVDDGLGPDGGPEFGGEYGVMRVVSDPPLSNNQFTLALEYGGCGVERAFVVFGRVMGHHADVWIRRPGYRDQCDMLVGDVRTFDLPAEATRAATVTLLAPGERQFTLR